MLEQYTPSYIGATTDPDTNPYEGKVGTLVVVSGGMHFTATVTFHVNTRPFLREMDKLRQSLSRLRYPPREPARGSVSRHREKLRKAGVRR